MKRMIITSSSASGSAKLPKEYQKWYHLASRDEVEEAGVDYDDMTAEMNEMAAAYGAKVVGYALADDEYYDGLADNGLDFLTIIQEDTGRTLAGIFVHDRFSPASLDEIKMCVGDDE